MTIGARASAGWTSGTFPRTVSVPATLAEGDMMLLVVGAKPYDAVISTPSGWTKIGTQQTNGSTASGVDTGSVTWAVFYKVAGASETDVGVTITTAAPGAACIFGYSKTKQQWVTPTAYHGSDTSSGTGYSATMSGSSGNITAGDMVQAAIIIAGDDATLTSRDIAATGLTMGTVFTDPSTDVASTGGDDLAATAFRSLVSSGTASANATVTATLSAAQTGGSPLVRLREVDTTLYWVIYTAEKSAPTPAQVIAGQDTTGSAAVASGSELSPTTTTNPFTFAAGATGLSAATAYKVAIVWTDGTNTSAAAQVSSTWLTNNAGSFAVTESGGDAVAFTGNLRVSGSFAVSEAATKDSVLFAGLVKVTGSFAVSEVGSDSAEFTTSTSNFGNFFLTESGPDTAAFSGKVKVSGAFAVTEIGSDTAHFTEAEGNFGTFYATESGSDTAWFSGLGQTIGVDVALDNTWTPVAGADSTWGNEYYTPLNWTREVRGG